MTDDSPFSALVESLNVSSGESTARFAACFEASAIGKKSTETLIACLDETAGLGNGFACR